MEYADGGNLCSYVKRRKRLAEGEAQRIFQELLEGVSTIRRREDETEVAKRLIQVQHEQHGMRFRPRYSRKKTRLVRFLSSAGQTNEWTPCCPDKIHALKPQALSQLFSVCSRALTFGVSSTVNLALPTMT